MLGFKFGSYLMQDPTNGRTVIFTDVFNSPQNDVQIDQLAEADGGLVVKQQFKPKTFTVNGHFQADTRAQVVAMRDAFKAAMSQKNQAFDVTDGGVIRRYLANAVNVAIADGGLTRIPYSVQFISADGMGWNIDNSDFVVSTGFNLASTSFNGAPIGSYLIEPTLIVTLTAVTGATNKSITIANGSTLRGIRITRTWANGDIIEINSLKKQVFVNNVAVDFEGQFPTWEPTIQPVVSYLDDMTSRTATIRGFYTPRWL